MHNDLYAVCLHRSVAIRVAGVIQIIYNFTVQVSHRLIAHPHNACETVHRGT